MANHNEVGKIGEQKASNYLKIHGHRIVERNFRTKTGEIDIIAEKNGVLIFAEVKTRTQAVFGVPSEAVNYYKRKNIKETAQMYIMKNNYTGNCRFDVIEIVLKKNIFGYTAEINHIENAFWE